MRNRLAILGAVIALVVMLAVVTKGFGLFGRDEGVLKLYGNVDVREVDLAFRVPGRIVSIGPEEGERVKKGEAIAQLDKRPYRDALSAATGQLGIAEAELDKARAGNRPQEIGQAEARLREAQAALTIARNEYDRRSQLVESGAISRQQFDETTAQYRTAQARLEGARQALSLLRAGARREDRAAAAAQVAAAAAGRDGARTDLEDTTLVAPVAGTVVTRAREPGAIVGAGETVVTLSIDRPLRLRSYVAAGDLSRISPGMAVQVSADGNPRIYDGAISQIASTAEFTPKTVQTEDLRADLVYRVRVLVKDPDDGLRQGQPVTITVAGARPKVED